MGALLYNSVRSCRAMARIEKRALLDGSTRYKAIIRRKAHPLKTKTFRTRAQAAAWAKRVEVMILDHKAIPTWEADRHTVADLVDRYIEEILPRKPRSYREGYRQLRWWKDQIGSYTLAATTPALISEYREKLSQGKTRSGTGRKPATVNRYMAALGHAFTVAVKEWGWVEANPVHKLSKLKEPRGRVRFLSDEERERLLEACGGSPDSRLFLVVVLAISTGARKGELLRLRWPDIDLKRGVAVLHQTKNDERRALPLTGLALAVLTERSKVRRLDTDLVFANSEGQPIFPRKAWEDALRAAEIEDFRFHDLRHSAASYLAMSGATLAEIAEVLGHKTLAMVKRYSHLTEQHTSKVVARMNEKIFGSH